MKIHKYLYITKIRYPLSMESTVAWCSFCMQCIAMYPSLHSGWDPLRNTSEGPIIPFCKLKKKPFEDPARTSAYAHILVELLWLRMTQGDLEKSLGWNPVPLFDRERAADMPVMQVKFQFQCMLCRSNSTSPTWLLVIISYWGTMPGQNLNYCHFHPVHSVQIFSLVSLLCSLSTSLLAACKKPKIQTIKLN